MRRTLFLLAAIMAGAVFTASAQARALLLARRDTLASNPTGLLVHVSNLMDDPQWADPLRNGYTINLHWKVQLWHNGRGFLAFDAAEPAREFDIEVQTTELMRNYTGTDRTAASERKFVFSTPDSLRHWLATDIRLGGPRLNSGEWYYTIEVGISALTQAQVDQRNSGTSAGLLGIVRNFVLGSGPQRTLYQRVDITVPRRSP